MSRLGDFFRLINQPCRDMTGLISKAMDGDLPFRERFAYRLHIGYCTACRSYRKQLLGLRTALRRAVQRLTDAETAPGPGPTLSQRARQRIAQALQDH